MLPAQIKSGYPEGILEIRHMNGFYKGRGLFLVENSSILVLLVVYRKSSRKTPQNVVDLALLRKREYEANL